MTTRVTLVFLSQSEEVEEPITGSINAIPLKRPWMSEGKGALTLALYPPAPSSGLSLPLTAESVRGL